jgi:hypothetical protein
MLLVHSQAILLILVVVLKYQMLSVMIVILIAAPARQLISYVFPALSLRQFLFGRGGYMNA